MQQGRKEEKKNKKREQYNRPTAKWLKTLATVTFTYLLTPVNPHSKEDNNNSLEKKIATKTSAINPNQCERLLKTALSNCWQKKKENSNKYHQRRLRVYAFTNLIRFIHSEANTQTLPSETAYANKDVHVAPVHKHAGEYKRGKCWQPTSGTHDGHEINSLIVRQKRRSITYNQNGTTKQS